MEILDLFYKTLAETDDISKATEAVRKEILKRKINIPKSLDSYEDLKKKHTALVNLKNKLRKIEKIKNSQK